MIFQMAESKTFANLMMVKSPGKTLRVNPFSKVDKSF
jgi:hypothetical protein